MQTLSLGAIGLKTPVSLHCCWLDGGGSFSIRFCELIACNIDRIDFVSSALTRLLLVVVHVQFFLCILHGQAVEVTGGDT